MGQERVLNDVWMIVYNDVAHERDILERIKQKKPGASSAVAETVALDTNEVFTLDSIRAVCETNRLRFLESWRYLGTIPAEAIHKARHIESSKKFKFQRFFMMAPAEHFLLENSTKDPVLLGELGDGRFYYIHHWGDDLAWYHRILKYPLRHFGSLSVVALAIGSLVALLLPYFTAAEENIFHRFFIASATAGLLVAAVIITGILTGNDFSENNWDSHQIK